ncbi:hypothetical protein [Shewanella benthica]|uniref:hypothetical protein n=1 Tax=Shewanella benthica TaxID=43661 RepID=UPI00058DAE43|nr:hypothetical protein [Shewanella benthica]
MVNTNRGGGDDRDSQNIVEQVLPVEFGMIESLHSSKTLLLMVVIGVIFFVGFFFLLLYMA